ELLAPEAHATDAAAARDGLDHGLVDEGVGRVHASGPGRPDRRRNRGVAPLRGRSRLHARGDAALRGAVVHDAVHQREQRVVAAHADVAARVDARAHLAHEDRAGVHLLTREALHAAALSVAVAAVARAALSLLVRH